MRDRGVLKSRVDDFRVKEQAKSPSIDSKGRFTAIRVTLRNWETNRFIGRLASACKISRNRIFSSGLKDKRAVTTQILVVDASSSSIEGGHPRFRDRNLGENPSKGRDGRSRWKQIHHYCARLCVP